ncbi:MAG: cation diffusion facilitator family transporter [Deltaproteobacteria bacterium]|nr:cation diffusion facilitator family transporter [Deltaproteobacteria bacterium]
MTEGSRRAIVAAFLANLGIAIAKLVAFSFTGAASMLAESVHSLADTGNQALLLLGSARARRAPTAEHPFGFGRERYFWAFVVALVLFSLGALFAIVEGIEKLLHPHELSSPEWALAVLAIAIVLEAFSLRTAIHEARALRGRRGWWSFIRRTKLPELPVVLLEDVGALLGLLFAAAGVGIALATGDPRWDALGSVAIGVLLGGIAAVLAIEMKSLIIGEAADPDTVEAIRGILAAGDGVTHVVHLRTLHIGPDDLLVAAKLAFTPELPLRAVADVVNVVEAAVRARVPVARLVFIEPDVWRSERAAQSTAAPRPR